MKLKTQIITCIASSDSPSALQQAEKIARENSSLDCEFSDTAVASPGGIKKTIIRQYHLGDYFEEIDIIRIDRLSFKIVFRVRRDADRYWKDAMAKFLRVIRKAGVSIKSIAKSIM